MSQEDFDNLAPPGGGQSAKKQIKIPLLQLENLDKKKKRRMEPSQIQNDKQSTVFPGNAGADGRDDHYQMFEDDGGQLSSSDLKGGAGQQHSNKVKKEKKLMLKQLATSIKNKVKKQKPTEQLKLNHHRYHNHCVFEPQNGYQYLMMIRMNAMEVICANIFGVAAIIQASWISSFFYFVIGMLYISAKHFVPDRMHKRQVTTMVIFIFLLIDLAFKIFFFTNNPSKTLGAKTSTKEEIETNVRWLESIGISSQVITQNAKEYPNGFIEINVVNSLIFEMIAMTILVIFYFYSRLTETNMKYLDEHALESHQLRVHEQDENNRKKEVQQEKHRKETEEDNKSEQSDQKESSEKKLTQSDIDNLEQKGRNLKLKKIYTQEMIEENLQILKKEEQNFQKYRNYIECDAFKKLHSTLFALVILANILQSLIFNSLVDISVLLLILMLKSLIAYKDTYKEFYMKLQFFTVYWLQLLTQIKIQFVINMSVPQITYWIRINQKNIYVQVVKSLLGLDFIDQENKTTYQYGMMIVYFVSLFVSLFSCQLWKQARWGAVRDMWIEEHNNHKIKCKKKKEKKAQKGIVVDQENCNEEEEEDNWGSSYTMASYYFIMHTIKSKEKLKKIQKDQQQHLNHPIEIQTTKANKSMDKVVSVEQAKTSELNEKYKYKQSTSDFLTYLPSLLLWTTRFLMIFQAYMYNYFESLFILIWVIMTLLVPNEIALYISIIFMIPFYSITFLLIYITRIKYVNELLKTAIPELRKQFLHEKLQMPVVEQILFYVILTNLFMMISALKPSILNSKKEGSSNSYFIKIYKNKLVNKHTSILWKFSFNLLKHVQKLVFLILFFLGTQDIKRLDSFKNLGLILLFAVYFTFDRVYRQTSIVPMVFVASFVLTKYYYDLYYHLLETDDYVNLQCNWIGMWSKDRKPNWKTGSNIYFRSLPPFDVWVLLVIFKLLNVINQLFKDTAEVNSLETKCYEAIRHAYPNSLRRWNNIKSLVGNQLIYIYIVIMIIYMSGAQVNLISFIMYSQNIMLIASVCRQNKTNENIQRQLWISRNMKYFASFVIMLDAVFMAIIGVHDTGHDSEFKKQHPWVYDNLSFVGLRISDMKHDLTIDQKMHLKKQKLYYQAIYLVMSILINDYFQKLQVSKTCEENWNNADFIKLYDYKTKEQWTKELKKKKKLKRNVTEQHGLEEESEDEEQKLKEENKMINIETFKKKQYYTKYDLLDRYNFRRWQTEFIVYELINWWPLLDYIASLSHVCNGFLILYVALYYNVSLFMFIYVASVTQYYINAIYRIEKQANKVAESVTIRSQIDIQFSSNICKVYNIISNYQFHHVRLKVWTFQLYLLCSAAILSYPTQIVKQVRDKLSYEQQVNPFNNHGDIIKKLDQANYWFYLCGIFTGNDAEELQYYTKSIGILFLGLFLEKAAINWLKNRWGCSYLNFQKFVEIETRNRSIHEDWAKTPTPFKPEHYKYHNFYKPHDFEETYDRLFQDKEYKNHEKEIENKYKSLSYLEKVKAKNEFKEFIPYKVAIRLKEVIQFSIRVDGRDQSLKLGGFDVKTNNMIEKLFTYIDAQIRLKDLQQELSDLPKQKDGKDLTVKEELMLHVQKCVKKRLHITNQIQRINKMEEIDIEEAYEEIDILKAYKIEMLEKIIKNAIIMKYKISFSKGMIFAFEALIMATLLISIALKSNVFSLIYLIFVFRYPFCDQKHQIFSRLCFYISISLSIQYLLYALNITQHTAVQKFPDTMQDYPFKQILQNKNFMLDEGYPFPVMFQFTGLIGKKHFLKVAYFLGIGVDSSQLENIMLDFFNLYFVSMYLLYFRNPIFDKTMKKVFWKLPRPSDPPEQWNRCADDVKKQMIWLLDPVPLEDKKFDIIREERQKIIQKKYIEQQKINIKKVQDMHKTYYDYNTVLINYVDLKYQEVWTDKFVKKIKNQLKDQIFYFRAVKQGSQVFYLGFHIITIFVIILLSIMRQSLISLIYLIVICIKIMYNVEDALKERSQNLQQDIEHLEEEIQIKHEKKKELEELNDITPSLEQEDQIKILKEVIEDQIEELKNNKFNFMQAKTNKTDNKMKGKSRTQIKKKKENKAHSLPFNFKYTLQILVIIDFSIQVVCQMPFIQYGNSFSKFGFRKIWYKGNENSAYNFTEYMSTERKYTGLQLLELPLILLVLNCIMIVFVFTQVAIFDSPGYIKYVTQKDGSLNLLLKLSVLKGKSVAYRFNNFKIIKILQIQKKKELVNNNFEELKYRMKNWRILKKQTLETGIQGLINQKPEVVDDLKQQVEESMGFDPMGNLMGKSQMRFSSYADKHVKKSKNNGSFSPNSKIKEEDEQMLGSSCDDSDDQKNIFAQEQNFDLPTMAEKQDFLRKMSVKLVEDRIKNINLLVDIYQFVQKNWIEQIFFKNEKNELEELVQQHSQGSIEIPTELERIMNNEAFEFIQQHFQCSGKGANNDLNFLIMKFKRIEFETDQNQDYRLIDIIRAKLDSGTKLKLKEMTRTWEFTRPGSMSVKLIETFFYFFMSKIQYIIYMCMIYSTFENAGLITIIYPFMIFGWALLEETRPTKTFWQVLKFWTTVVLFCKFFCNIKWTIPDNMNEPSTTIHVFINDYLQRIIQSAHSNASDSHQSNDNNIMGGQLFGYIKLGLFQYDTIGDITVYILPEVFILCLLMVNSIYLRMLGFRNQQEHDIEDINDGIHRTIERGDIEKVKFQQKQDCYMNLHQQFPSINQLKRDQMKEQKMKEEHDQFIYGPNNQEIVKIVSTKEVCLDREFDQENVIKKISMDIKNATQNYSIDPNDDENQNQKKFVQKKQFQKVLDDDILIFIEGAQLEKNFEFIHQKESHEDYLNFISNEIMSGGDNEIDFNNKSDVIKRRNKPVMGVFERLKYFNRMFPSLKIQKPGYDLYGCTNIFLTIVIVFVFSFYDAFNVSQSIVIPGKEDESNIFSNGMIMLVLFIITCMLFERFANRTATKAPMVNQGLNVDEGEDLHTKKQYFHSESLILTQDNQSGGKTKKPGRWTRGLNKKADPRQKISLSDASSLNYLVDLQEENKVNRTKISIQQKVKYFMHMILLLLVHFYIFWFVPISGNIKLYGSPDCNTEKEKYYGCKDFHRNPYLKFFYLVLCCYLFMSAMQIKFGLPIMKIPSSVLQYNDNLVAFAMANVYQALPFIVEIRCLIDFSFAKTSLDIFQFWELYQANFDMYNGKNGNIYYAQKVIGEPMPKLDRCLMGFLFSGVVLLILCGPLILFSPMAGFIAPNPVLKVEMNINFLITKQISDLDMKRYVTGDISAKLQEYDSLNLETIQTKPDQHKQETGNCKGLLHNKTCTTDWYVLFLQKNAQLRSLNETLMDESKFQNWTESRFFQPDQIQLCLASEYPDKRWQMSLSRQEILKKEMVLALDEKNPMYHLNLGINMLFDREYPPGTKKHAHKDQLKSLNTSLIHDCQTKKQLLEYVDFKCSKEKPSFEITYYEAFSPYVILGDTDKAELLSRKPLIAEEKAGVHELMHDMKLTYQCNTDEWVILSTVNSTHQTFKRNKAMLVDPETCMPIDQDLFDQYQKSINGEQVWSRVTFMLFSMLVSSSFLASYSLTSFYLGVVYLLGSTIRVMLIWPSYKSFMYEAVETDSVLRLVDYIYNRRYEEDLAGEEEGYRMLREILMTPEFFKSICGSCMRGTLDPAKDYLSKDDEKKIIQIESLEKKGFEVKKLKERILEKASEKFQANQEDGDNDEDDMFHRQ